MADEPKIGNLSFADRAKAFKEKVEKAEKKYMVKINIGWIWTVDNDQLIIEDEKEPHDRLYYETLSEQDKMHPRRI